MMSLEEVMKSRGFNFSASCAGKGSYTKWIKHRGKRAYVAVTDTSGEGFPASLGTPRVGWPSMTQVRDELEAAQDISSLSAYLASLVVKVAQLPARRAEMMPLIPCSSCRGGFWARPYGRDQPVI